MNKQLKQQILVVSFGVTLFAALMNLNDVAGFFRTFTSILSPVFSGLLLAFILSVPMLGIARRLTGIFPRLKEKTVDALSLALTMVCVVVLVSLPSDRPVLRMVTTMLDKAFAKIPDGTNLILHSDQGWQYQHKQYQRMLREKGIRQSMSRKGNCLDNAVIENFFGLLKSELLYLQKFHSMEHFKQELVEYLDYYNNRRIKAKLKGLPPAIHRQQALSAA